MSSSTPTNPSKDNNDPRGICSYLGGYLGEACRELLKPATRNIYKDKKPEPKND